MADAVEGAGPPTLDDGSSWEAFCDQLKRAGRAILENAPDDRFDRAEGFRYLSRLTTHGLRSFIEQSDPARCEIGSMACKIGADNPDYVYGSAPLSGAEEYVLRGRRNDAHRLGIGTFYGGLGTEEGLLCSGYVSDEEIEFAPDGSFEIALSCQKQPGNWLPMNPETNQLTIRQTLLERRSQTPAHIELRPAGSARLPAPVDPDGLARALAGAGQFVEGTVQQFIGWTNRFARHKNEIHPADPSLLAFAHGDPSTHYHYGYFELGPGELLRVELDPPECEYWNLQVANHWMESLEYEYYTTHCNQHTATRRDDGSVQIAIGPEDPGLPNWIDTVGHRRGTIALRWVGAPEDSLARTRVVKLDPPRGAAETR